MWIIRCKGHGNIKAEHYSTLEFTKEKKLTEKGDCIVAVNCDQSIKDIPEDLKKHLLKGGKINVKIKCCGEEDEIVAFGFDKLLFLHKTDIVLRKSEYIDERTLGVKASKAAKDLKRSLVKKLKQDNVDILIEIGPVV